MDMRQHKFEIVQDDDIWDDNDNDNDNDKDKDDIPCFPRYGMIIAMICGLVSIPWMLLHHLTLYTNDGASIFMQNASMHKNCSSMEVLKAQFGHLPPQKYDLWSLPQYGSYETMTIPVYLSQDIREDKIYSHIKYAYIVQHGNLRNGFDYYCSAIHSLSQSSWDETSYVVIAPQFLTENDTCWDASSTATKVDILKGLSCDLPIYTSEGWKDGHLSKTKPGIYSYDIFNSIISELGNQSKYPNLEFVTFFGFSAGAQVALRYSLFSNFILTNPNLRVRYVVSDPSTFVYLSKERPFTNNSLGFGVPDESWILPEWSYSHSDGSNWTYWDTNCQSYNNWRYGLEKLNGYVEHRVQQDEKLFNVSIENFQYLDVTYLLGTEDDVNCKLLNTSSCNDHELATYCQAMLQGSNRVDRMLKWNRYLNYFYGHPVHHLIEAAGISHDPVAMMHSTVGKCSIFGMCPEITAKYPIFTIT